MTLDAQISWRSIVRSKLNENHLYEIHSGTETKTGIKALSAKIASIRTGIRKAGFESLEGVIIGLAMESSVEWIAGDLLSLAEGATTVPVPMEFSDNQLRSLLSRVDLCLVNNSFAAMRLSKLVESPMYNVSTSTWSGVKKRASMHATAIHPSVVKIIHTSGSTSDPKGVMITDESLCRMVTKLTQCLHKLGTVEYASVLPLSLLIEQILGVYLPLFTGGTTILPMADSPSYSTAVTDPRRYLNALAESSFNLTMLPPDLLTHLALSADEYILRQLTPRDHAFPRIPKISNSGVNLPLIATGGGTVPMHLITHLTSCGFHILQGYGLSENSSVVSWNTTDHHRMGSVGKPLPGVSVRIKSGEIQVRSDTLAFGYIGDQNSDGSRGGDTSIIKRTDDGYLQTGDSGFLDEHGYLFVTGRIKNTITLANSRKVCPEWIEETYRSCASVLHVIVVGEGLERPRAFVVSDSKLSPAILAAEMTRVGEVLPTFARVDRFAIIQDNNEFLQKYFTITGRPKRELLQKESENFVWLKIRSFL